VSRTTYRYHQQKRNAERRGIVWEPTYPNGGGKSENPALGERGRRSNQYCMARFNDTVGPHAVGNVLIITPRQNRQEHNMSEEQRRDIKA
jgi:hypothetical protein